MSGLHAMIDTNVVFEGLTKRGGASGLIVDTWLAGFFRACVSNALAYEYTEVLSRKISANRWQQIKPVLGALLTRADFTAIHYTWRPASPDPADDHLIDCTMNAGALLVTWNVKDVKSARASLGLKVMTPIQFLRFFVEQE